VIAPVVAALAALVVGAADTVENCRMLGRRAGVRATGDTASGAVVEEVRGVVRLVCPFRRGHEPLPVDVVRDSTDVIVELRAFIPGHLRPQKLAARATGPLPRDRAFLRSDDVDADGWGDLELLSSWGATGNTAWQVWRFDPRGGRFVYDEALSRLSNFRPLPGGRCYESTTAGDLAGRVYTKERLCRDGDSLQVVWSERQTADSSGRFLIRTTTERRGGRLETVRTDTLP
jgi:hypothetical protein